MKLPQRFIVVDDDRTSNMICEFSLRRFSAETEIKTFIDPELALKFIEESYSDENNNTPTLLFLDINMPALTAWEFLEIFKNFPSSIKDQFVIYILTSSIDYRDKEKADTDPHVSGSLCKPLSTAVVCKIFSEEENN